MFLVTKYHPLFDYVHPDEIFLTEKLWHFTSNSFYLRFTFSASHVKFVINLNSVKLLRGFLSSFTDILINFRYMKQNKRIKQ